MAPGILTLVDYNHRVVPRPKEPFVSQNPAQRDAFLNELRRLDAQVGSAKSIDDLKPIYYRLEEIGQSFPTDSGMQTAISDVRNKMVAFGQRLMEMQSTAEREAAAKMPGGAFAPPVQQPTQVFQSGSLTAKPPAYAPPPTAPPPTSIPPPPGPPPSSPPPFNWKRAVAVGGVVGLLIAAGGIYTIRNAQKKAEEQKQVPEGAASIAIKTSPVGASIRVNGEVKCTSNCNIELPTGTYEVLAVMPGYESATSALNVVGGTPSELALTLQPMPLSVRLFTDLQAGKVTLDGNPLGDLQDGQLVLDRVSPGKHTVKVTNQATEASFDFESQLGQAPVIVGPVVAKNVLAIVVSNAGKAAKVHSSANVKVQVDGTAAGDAGPSGLALDNLPPGDRELAINDGSVDRKLLVSVGAQPTLTAYLKLDVNLGSLYVAAGDLDDVTVFLNNTELKRKTKGGQLRLLGLPVRQYMVRVVKDGYTAEAAKPVTVAKGQETRVEFALKAIPKLANLKISGATPGTAVLLDGQGLGIIAADGTYSSTTIAPGEHTIEFRRESFAPKRNPRQFRAGETVELSGADVTLVAAASSVKVNVKPATAQIFYRKSDETQLRQANGNTINVGAGTWVVVAKAANFVDGTTTVQVASGENKTVEIALKEAPKVVTKKLGTMLEWEQPGEWVQQEGWTVHKGGNFVLYGITPPNGTFTFNIALLKGRRLQWFADYKDSKNHVLYQLDRKNFFRRDVVNGRSSEYKAGHDLEKQESYTIQIDISPGAVRHSLHNGTKWIEMDTFTSPGRNLTEGKFGLYIPGSDVFGLSNFRFNPR